MFALGAGADFAAFQHGVHFALSLIRLHVVSGRNLAHQVVLTLERRHILLGEESVTMPFQAYSSHFRPEEAKTLAAAYDAAWNDLSAERLTLPPDQIPVLKRRLAQLIQYATADCL
jgi:hypothetical protein